MARRAAGGVFMVAAGGQVRDCPGVQRLRDARLAGIAADAGRSRTLASDLAGSCWVGEQAASASNASGARERILVIWLPWGGVSRRSCGGRRHTGVRRAQAGLAQSAYGSARPPGQLGRRPLRPCRLAAEQPYEIAAPGGVIPETRGRGNGCVKRGARLWRACAAQVSASL